MLETKSQSLSFRSSIGGVSLSRSASALSPSSTRLNCFHIVSENLYGERFRLHTIAPQDGSRKRRKRKGRGYAAGQGGSCGFGMRGQRSRAGPGVRPGFEGGQTPLYRRLPKLKGVAGGMPAGQKKFVTINIDDLNEKYKEGEIVDLATLKEKRIINPTGKEKKLPLKVLGEGELKIPLEIHAAHFSGNAKEKIEAVGGTISEVPMKPKWTRERYEQQVANGEITPKKTKRYYYLQKA